MSTIALGAAAPSVVQRRRAVVAGTAGNFVEWFDWSIYGFMVPSFAATFFPKGNDVAQTLSAFVVFAVGFFLRPLGGAVLGSYADRHGRKAGMTLTIAMMAAASLAMAFIPSHHAIGIGAAVLLVLCRSVQGFSAGGEFGTSSAFLVERAPQGRRATVGAWQQVSVGGGTLLAALLTMVLTKTQGQAFMTTWGWRLGFVVAGLLGLVALYLRARVDDTEQYNQLKRANATARRPLLDVVRHHPWAALRVFAYVAAGAGLVQFWFVSIPAYANLKVGASLADGQLATTISLAVFVALQPLMGWLSDRIGRKPMLLFFVVGSAITFPFCLGMLKPGLLGVLLPELIATVFLSAYAGSLAAIMAEQFPAAVRTAGIALPYGIAVAIFGGLFPVWATRFLATPTVWIAIVIATCVLSAVAFLLMRETKDDEL